MSIFTQSCTFPDPTAEILDATLGWDAVYSVSYAAVNAVFAHLKPWEKDFGLGVPGLFHESAGDDELSGTITAIGIARGGSGQHVRFDLDLANVVLTRNPPATVPQKIVNIGTATVRIDCQLAFHPDPATPGLHSLTVDVETGVQVVETSATLDPVDEIVFKAMIQNLLDQNLDMFQTSLAQVVTVDYPESVNIPWLTPKAFSYAVADTVDGTDGILGVLISTTDESTAGLTAQITPLVFPTNVGINANVVLSNRLVSDNTFLSQLNTDIGTGLGEFIYDEDAQALVNKDPIDAYYRIDADTNEVSLIGSDSLDTSTGTTYSVVIPAHALTISYAGDGITASITGAEVDLKGGYKQIITISSNYQLVVDPETQEIDMVLYGSPVVTTNFVSPETTSSGEMLGRVFAVGLGFALGEAIPILIDRIAGFVTKFNLTDTRMFRLTQRFYAAEAQMLVEKSPVQFDIDSGRKVTIRNPDAGPANASAFKLTQTYIDASTLRPVLAGSENVAPTSNLDADLGNIALAHKVYVRVWNNVANIMAERVRLREIATKAGLSDTIIDRYFPVRNIRFPEAGLLDIQPLIPFRELGRGDVSVEALQQNTMPALHATFRTMEPVMRSQGGLYLPEINEFSVAKIYETCIAYTEQTTIAGGTTGSLYGQIVDKLPEATKKPETARLISAARLERNQNRAIRITTSPVDIGTRARPGLFADFRGALETRRAGVGASLIRDIIRDTPRPLWTKLVGGVLYAGGLVAGFYLSKMLDKAFVGTPGSSQAGAGLTIASGGAKGPASLLFSNVTFPLMTQFQDGNTGPKPQTVLKCAAVKGGLVLGVEIELNR